MNVSVNAAKCTRKGVCYGTGSNGCPTVFAQGGDGKAIVIQTPTTDFNVYNAQANCCIGAITIS
ncbi:ferredoxin [bacterium]|nr:ferredoxin [bacterium]